MCECCLSNDGDKEANKQTNSSGSDSKVTMGRVFLAPRLSADFFLFSLIKFNEKVSKNERIFCLQIYGVHVWLPYRIAEKKVSCCSNNATDNKSNEPVLLNVCARILFIVSFKLSRLRARSCRHNGPTANNDNNNAAPTAFRRQTDQR